MRKFDRRRLTCLEKGLLLLLGNALVQLELDVITIV